MMPEVDHHHPPHPTGNRRLDLVLPICALFVSVVSLGLAIIHGRAIERMADANAKLVKANSWPFLQYSTSNISDGKPIIDLSIDNAGVGPADIRTFEVFWRGKPMHNHSELLEACCGYEPGSKLPLESNLINYRVMPARASQVFLSLPRTDAYRKEWDRLDAERINVKTRVCYCSVFEECWIGLLTILAPSRQTPVARCPTPAVSYVR